MGVDNSVLGLATIRHNRGLSLDQIAAATKIGIRSLRAIEDGDFQKLPGGIYNTSYIKQYARAIDFDEDELLAFYYARMNSPAEAPPQRSHHKDWLGGLRHPRSVTGIP